MKKEVFLAIIIGFGLGLIITYGIWIANKSLKDLPKNTASKESSSPTTAPNPTSSPTDSSNQTPSSGINLSISSPENESLVTNNTVTITGTTTAGATIAILHEKGELLIEADPSGNFSSDLVLEGGYNLITLTAHDSTGNQISKNLMLTYTTSKI